MRVAVIGTGPAGMACAKALVRRGLKPTILDVGETLPEDRQAIVDRMAGMSPAEWSPQDKQKITYNPTVGSAKVPKKVVFGSDFYFAASRGFSTMIADQGLPVATFARGGFSVAWGAALLPTHDNDMEDWPIRQADLEPSYRRVMCSLPMSASHDALEKAFPLFKETVSPLPMSDDARALLADFSALNSVGPDASFLSGQARLAVDAAACRSCGLCLSGCVYGAIYSTAPDVTALSKAGSIQYTCGRFVEKLVEDEAGVGIVLRRIETDTLEKHRFDYVFLAAGAIQSTRIVLESLNLYDQTVEMKDSQKLVVPLLRVRRFPLAWPRTLGLASLFVDFNVPEISNHWVHAQISSVNDYVLQHLRVSPWTNGLWRRTLAPFYERILIAWCGLHSDHSSGIAMTLASEAHGHRPIVRLRSKLNPQTHPIVHKVGRYFARIALRARTWVVTPALMVGPPGGGNHFGSTLPMRANPLGRLETDVLGRLAGWRRIHIVDGAILPSIPATTIALLQMANADRIAMSAEFG